MNDLEFSITREKGKKELKISFKGHPEALANAFLTMMVEHEMLRAAVFAAQETYLDLDEE